MSIDFLLEELKVRKAIANVTGLFIDEYQDSELPYRVKITRKGTDSIYGAGETLGDAAKIAFEAGGIFSGSKTDLKNFIFWNFNGGENWVRIIQSLGDQDES